jgi:hypothetical protein
MLDPKLETWKSKRKENRKMSPKDRWMLLFRPDWSNQQSFRFFVCGCLASVFSLFLTSHSQAQSPQRMAQIKSQRMAQVGFPSLALSRPSPYSSAPLGMRHVYPLRRPAAVGREGVGYSPHSAAQAIRNACFYGQRPMIAQAVVRGRDGYYATVYYR